VGFFWRLFQKPLLISKGQVKRGDIQRAEEEKE